MSELLEMRLEVVLWISKSSMDGFARESDGRVAGKR